MVNTAVRGDGWTRVETCSTRGKGRKARWWWPRGRCEHRRARVTDRVGDDGRDRTRREEIMLVGLNKGGGGVAAF